MQCKDKFLIQSTFIPFGSIEEDITSDMFAKDSGKYIVEKKLRVILTVPPPSPILLPINGVLKQDPSCEASMQKEIVWSGVENIPPPQKPSLVIHHRKRVEVRVNCTISGKSYANQKAQHWQVQIECPISEDSNVDKEGHMKPLRKIRPNEVMEAGARVYIPVSVAETRISKRFDSIPSGTLYPNADEIEYLQRLVKYKDYAIIVVNKPPKLPVKGNLPVHNSMDALAATALSYDYDEGPKLVHRLDRESNGLLLMGRTKESVDHLQWLFSDIKKENFSCKCGTWIPSASIEAFCGPGIGHFEKERWSLVYRRGSDIM
ncbi:hypothetical protein CMV_023257 [Castanea mollissima]|uniref:Pseudouridine synthase RsuA/RluA-like domain-containing protein n=1 Tax=Castanea mollissima TaxID=60419 RepID=A0A8J4VAT6_9ROSI|nr:hypothetical protein CMV_023257 [Castanea mollissima]